MNRLHMPRVDARYWVAITLASIFGTNLGDLYAHESGLGIVRGLLVLATLAAATFIVEKFDRRAHELYYWLVIIIIRTGATNIADYLAFRVHLQPVALSAALGGVIALLAWRAARIAREQALTAAGALPDADAAYWTAMLAAGIFGTVLGDVCSHLLGQGVASISLGLLLAAVFLWRRGAVAAGVGLYWLTVAVARTTGTAMGDWIAENKILNIGLPLATLMTGTAFVAVLLILRSRPAPAVAR